MDEITISSVTDLLNDLSQREDKDEVYMMFRGQSSIEWPLLPSIARFPSTLDGYDDWMNFEKALIENFKQYSFPYLDKKPLSYIEWLILAQHHGIPTRLLDWTTNPLKGLFFAVENLIYENDGVLWALEPAAWWEGDDVKTSALLKKHENANWLSAYMPDHSQIRIVAQESCFTIFPFPNKKKQMPPIDLLKTYDKSINNLRKYRILGSAKQGLIIELSRLGVKHRTIFPSLDGVAKSVLYELGLYYDF
ncbi:MAG: FRG domain-containing protein [Gammaproteobacteria bacterium]|nr:FRG domain-containing protein [Gammaproteobacteria bacterium]